MTNRQRASLRTELRDALPAGPLMVYRLPVRHERPGDFALRRVREYRGIRRQGLEVRMAMYHCDRHVDQDEFHFVCSLVYFSERYPASSLSKSAM